MRENAALAAAQVDGFGQLPEHVAFAGQFFGKLFRSQGLGCEVSLLHYNFLNFLSALSLSTISFGVPAGAKMPCHVLITKSGIPLSAKVGTSFN